MGVDQSSCRDITVYGSDKHPIEINRISSTEVGGCKFVFGGNWFQDLDAVAVVIDALPFLEVSECD
jgi:hypothetical protein